MICLYGANWARCISTACDSIREKSKIRWKLDFHYSCDYTRFNWRTESPVNEYFDGKSFIHNFIFIFFVLISAPNGMNPFRTLGIGQRPFVEPPFTSHLRDLDFRRKAPPLTAITTSINNTSAVHSSSNGLSSSDCQDYKPNAPQIQGKNDIYFTPNVNPFQFHGENRLNEPVNWLILCPVRCVNEWKPLVTPKLPCAYVHRYGYSAIFRNNNYFTSVAPVEFIENSIA